MPLPGVERPYHILFSVLLLFSLTGCVANAPQWNLSQCFSQIEKLREISNSSENRIVRQQAYAYCDRVLQISSQGREAGLARDLIRVVDGRLTYLEKQGDCTFDAQKVIASAGLSFRAGDHRVAVKLYEQAVTLCPQGSEAWIRLGHTNMSLGNSERAKELLLHGLRLDPWNRSGHLFLADLYRLNGQIGNAYDHAALAVLSDPNYELGWETFREIVQVLGLSWRRTPNNRARVVLSDKGAPQVFLPPGTLNTPGAEFWIGLSLVEAAELKEATRQPNVAKDTRTALEKDRERIKKNLEFQQYTIAKDPSKRTVLTDVIEDAARSGFLDEAIFLHLMDVRLAAEYTSYRDANKTRLLEYISTKIAPVVPK